MFVYFKESAKMKVKCPTCGFDVETDASRELQPIGTLGYIGYMVLFMIPILGIVMLLVFAFGGTKNQNLKNFARAYLCIIAAAAVLWATSLSFGQNDGQYGYGQNHGTNEGGDTYSYIPPAEG